MVSWFVKEALVDAGVRPRDRHGDAAAGRPAGWAAFMREVGVTGIHIAERDTQRAVSPKPIDMFWNTWSVDGFISEGLQPAELGWGTHERWMPANARTPRRPGGAGHLPRAAGCRDAGPHLVPVARRAVRLPRDAQRVAVDLRLLHRALDDGEVEYRPTCHYAYHPCNDAVLSFHELFGAAGRAAGQHVLDEDEIVDGRDELGVLLYGHARNAYWYGSQLTIEEARELAPYQNATGLQVTSAVLAGMVWALENPRGRDRRDRRHGPRAMPRGAAPVSRQRRRRYTDWTPLAGRPGLFADDIDTDDPWQFRNVLVH